MASQMLVAVLLAMVVASVSAQATTYTITLSSDNKYNVLQGTTTLTGGAVSTTQSGSVTEIPFTGGAQKIQFYSSPISRTLADINATITPSGYLDTQFDSVVEIAPNVFRARDLINYPYSIYWINSSFGDVTCNSTVPVGSDAFWCRGIAFFQYTAPSSISTSSASLSVVVYDPNYQFLVLSLAASRVTALLGLANKVQMEIDANASAVSNAQTAVGFLYAFVAMSMVLISLIIAIWQSWICPCMQAINMSMLVWFIIITVIVWLVTIFGGAVGWICILVIFCIYVLVLPSIYACCWCRRKRFCCKGGAPQKGSAGKPGASAASVRSAASASYSEQQESWSYTSEEQEESDYPYSDEANSYYSGDNNDDDSSADSRYYRQKENRRKSSEEAAGPTVKQQKPSSTGARPAGDVKGFNKFPNACGHIQKCLFIVFTIMSLLWLLCIIIIFYAWKNQEYSLYNRGTGQVETEFQPSTVAKGVWVIYAFPRLADLWRVNPLLVANTFACGKLYNTVLNTDEEKKKSIFDAYINEYSIDMSIYARQSYTQYTTVNDWFTRALAPGVRPIAFPNDNQVLISGADCRLTVFTKVPADQEVWLKDNPFTIETLIGDSAQASYFTNGAMSILRLAPADYHRTHSPIAGTIIYQQTISSTIFSVGANPMKSQNGAVYNTRVVTIIQGANPSQRIAFVAIGATCVGSIVMMKSAGMSVAKGENFSYFQFGGSTVAIIYPANSVLWDSDLLYATQHSTEMLVREGNKIGTWLV